MQTSADETWPPNKLAWRQRVAAYWSLAWPAALISWLLLDAIGSFAQWLGNPHPIYIYSELYAGAFFVTQAFFVRRLVRKNYRTFRVEVLRNHLPGARNLQFQEHVAVAVRLLLIQVGGVIALSLMFILLSFIGHALPAALSGLAGLFFFLGIGPASVGFAVCSNYWGFPDAGKGFRLQSYALRFI